MKMSGHDRILLLLTGVLAGYQIAIGINGLGTFVITAYTVAFGVLLVSVILMFILGFEVLDSPVVVTVSTIIPLSLSLGLIWQHAAAWSSYYLGFVIVGFLAIFATRAVQTGRFGVVVLAIVHAVAGVIIFLLPIAMLITGQAPSGFLFVSVGGGMIGLVGLWLTFYKTGRSISSRLSLLNIFPALLMVMTFCYVIGFAFV